jgi:ornithine cyclodeaminase/alanine dehydrogenase-like protein (mu-crystallin family)
MYLDKLANTRTITNHNALSAMRRPDTTRIRAAMLRRRANNRIRANVDTITDRERPRQDRRLKHLTISTNDYLAMRLVNDHAASRI